MSSKILYRIRASTKQIEFQVLSIKVPKMLSFHDRKSHRNSSTS